MLYEITVFRDAGGIAFRPHSERADNFLFHRFASIGDRDLTDLDVERILDAARERGWNIRRED